MELWCHTAHSGLVPHQPDCPLSTLLSYDHTYSPPGTSGYFGIHSVLSWCQICWNRSGQPNVLLFVYVETLSALHHPTSSSPAEDNGARENDRTNEGNNYTLQDLSSTLRFDEHFHRRHRFWSSQRPSAQAGLAIFISTQRRTLKSREVRTRAQIHRMPLGKSSIHLQWRRSGLSGLVSHPPESFGERKHLAFPSQLLHFLLPSFYSSQPGFNI